MDNPLKSLISTTSGALDVKCCAINPIFASSPAEAVHSDLLTSVPINI